MVDGGRFRKTFQMGNEKIKAGSKVLHGSVN